jgi:4-alpha-glucanotransferase
VAAQRRVRDRQVAGLRGEVTRRGGDAGAGDPVGLLAGVVEVLGASDAPAVLVSIDDLVGASQPQNVPGTPSDRPNWVLRLGVPIEDLAADPAATGLLRRLDAARRAHSGSPTSAGGPSPQEASGE